MSISADPSSPAPRSSVAARECVRGGIVTDGATGENARLSVPLSRALRAEAAAARSP